MTLLDTDTFMVQRGNDIHQVASSDRASDVQDDDLFLVARDGINYKIRGEFVKGGESAFNAPILNKVTLTKANPSVVRFDEQTFVVTPRCSVLSTAPISYSLRLSANGTIFTEPETSEITNIQSWNTTNNWVNYDTSKLFNSLAWSPKLGVFIACQSSEDKIWKSIDGVNWVSETAPKTGIGSITWVSDAFDDDGVEGVFFMWKGGAGAAGAMSSDGVNWVTKPGTDSKPCWSKKLGIWVHGGGTTCRWSENNMNTWNAPESGISGADTRNQGMAYNPVAELFCTVSYMNGSKSWTSGDGKNWTQRTARSDAISINYGNGNFWMGAYDSGSVQKSSNGTSWGGVSIDYGNATRVSNFLWCEEVNWIYMGCSYAPSASVTHAPYKPLGLSKNGGSSFGQVWSNTKGSEYANFNMTYSHALRTVIGVNQYGLWRMATTDTSVKNNVFTLSSNKDFHLLKNGDEVTTKEGGSGATGIIVGLDPVNNTMVVQSVSGNFVVGDEIAGPKSTVEDVKLYTLFDAEGNISDLVAEDPGYRPVLTGDTIEEAIDVTFPAFFPNGKTPDETLPEGATLCVDVKATNDIGEDTMPYEESGACITPAPAERWGPIVGSTPNSLEFASPPFDKPGQSIFMADEAGNPASFLPATSPISLVEQISIPELHLNTRTGSGDAVPTATSDLARAFDGTSNVYGYTAMGGVSRVWERRTLTTPLPFLKGQTFQLVGNTPWGEPTLPTGATARFDDNTSITALDGTQTLDKDKKLTYIEVYRMPSGGDFAYVTQVRVNGFDIITSNTATQLTFEDATDLSLFAPGQVIGDGIRILEVDPNAQTMVVSDSSWSIGQQIFASEPFSGTGTVQGVSGNNLLLSASNNQWKSGFYAQMDTALFTTNPADVAEFEKIKQALLAYPNDKQEFKSGMYDKLAKVLTPTELEVLKNG